MKFDDVVEAVKPFGLYQKRTYFLVCLIGIPAALHTMVTVFIMATPDHRSECDVIDSGDVVTCVMWVRTGVV